MLWAIACGVLLAGCGWVAWLAFLAQMGADAAADRALASEMRTAEMLSDWWRRRGVIAVPGADPGDVVPLPGHEPELGGEAVV